MLIIKNENAVLLFIDCQDWNWWSNTNLNEILPIHWLKQRDIKQLQGQSCMGYYSGNYVVIGLLVLLQLYCDLRLSTNRHQKWSSWLWMNMKNNGIAIPASLFWRVVFHRISTTVSWKGSSEKASFIMIPQFQSFSDILFKCKIIDVT